MKKLFSNLIVYILLFQAIFQVNSQEGSPYIINFEVDDDYKLQYWAIIQDRYENMFFANRKGVLVFDGYEWDMVSVPSFPLTMITHPEKDMVIVGCDNDIGYINKNNEGVYEYTSIKPNDTDVGFIIEMAIYNNALFLLSDR